MRGVYKKSLSYWILLSLEKTVDGVVRINDFINNLGYYAYGSGWEYPLDKSDLAQAIKRLRKRGLINEDKVNETEVVIKLTKLGQDALGAKFDERTWDGKWRIVIFDIPEQKRMIRNLFRRNLKKWGFKPLQKSVWFSKQDIFSKLDEHIKELGIEDWVVIMESEKLSSIKLPNIS